MKRVCIALLTAGACQSTPIMPPQPAGPAIILYPEELWDAGAEGTTLLRLYVAPSGNADSAQVSRSSGFPALDEAALGGAASLRFKPARHRDGPVGTWVRLPVHFRLQPAPEQRPDES
jgi:TonB family protein